MSEKIHESEIRYEFAKISKFRQTEKYKNHVFEDGQLERIEKNDGIRIFKRKVLGLCGSKTVKSIDELADALMGINVVRSLEEGREMIPKLYGKCLTYSTKHSTHRLYFDEIEYKGRKACKILRFKVNRH